MAAAPSPADGVMPTAAAEVPKLSLEILDVIKTAQAQNGLRHGDYERYRGYCARRLARMRSCVKSTHTHAVKERPGQTGKARKYAAKVITPEAATDPRHLAIHLVNAERAWADASAVAGGEEATSAERNTRRTRLRRALQHAEALLELARARADARTVLEAEAYAAFMRGSLSMDAREWKGAFTAFAGAREVYERLGTVASRRLKELYAARVEELAPLEKFAGYQHRRSGGAREGAPGGVSAKEGAKEGEADLRTRIEAALAEAGSLGDKDGDFSHVTWRGVTVPVKNEKLKAALAGSWARGTAIADKLASQRGDADAAAALPGAHLGSASDASTEAAYLELFTRYDEAARMAGVEASRCAKEGKDAAAVDAKSVEDFARFHRVRHFLDRNDAQVAAAVREFRAQVTNRSDAEGRGAAEAPAAPTSAPGKGSKRKAPAVASSSSTTAVNAFAASPLQAALLGLGAAPASAASSSATAAAATQVAAFLARSLKTVDELLVLAGANASASAAAPSAGTDKDLVAVLQVKREVYAAIRCYYVGVTLLAQRKFSDATVMMHRATQRADAAAAALQSLPPSVRSKGLPAFPAGIDSRLEDIAALPPSVVNSGLSQADVSAIEQLQRTLANDTIKLQATALLEQSIGSRLRVDGSFAEAWDTVLGPNAPLSTLMAHGVKLPAAAVLPSKLVRSSTRPTSLVERTSSFRSVPSSADPASLADLPVAPMAVPFKPLLFDLAGGYIDYPDSVYDRATALETRSKSSAAASRSAAASTPSSAVPAASDAGSASKGTGLFGWLTGK